MKFINVLFLAASVSAVAIEQRHHKGKTTKPTTSAAAAVPTAAVAAGAGAAVGAGAATAATVASGQTLVLKEVGGVPGNECLTFRNNGEIVDAACVNTAIDRQVTPTTLNGASVLKVQRTFTPDFRADLTNTQACLGFNGTHFKAEPCGAAGIQAVTFTGGQLKATGGACASGHDSAAQIQVDATGKTCATFTSTSVTPATA